ncbi:MAG TPA: efflux RND transporter periplasmic adaptor subunit [Xanthobacteraceae bacterium]|nr:efflux RND transporter periplasmic adaptor subunit [Xanthobacteraceae bacterium]
MSDNRRLIDISLGKISNNRRALAVAVAALIIFGAAALILMPQQRVQEQVRGSRGGGGTGGPIPVLAEKARLADVPVYLDGVGTAKALNTVTVRPQVEGKLISINFKEGQDVPKGYVLARIDPTTYQAQLDQAIAKKAQDEAQLGNAKLDLERYQRLAASNSITKQQADTQQAMVTQLQAQVQADQAAIDNARAVLSYTTITAPISGRTGIRQVDEGNIVHTTDTNGIVVLTQIKPISVLFNLPQQDVARVNLAFAQHPLRVDALGSNNQPTDEGVLQVVDNQVDPTTGTVKLKAEFPNSGLQLWPGQFVNVRMLIDTLKQVVVVPTAAVQRGPNGPFVFVVDGDHVTIHPVTVSQQNDTQAVIASGVQAGNDVVTTGFAQLAEGTRVRVSAGQNGGAGAPSAGEVPAQDPAAISGADRGRAGNRPNDTGRGTRQRRSSAGAASGSGQ